MRKSLCAALFSITLAVAQNPRLAQVQTVYILPMRGGMDQFLANRLVRLGKIQVVADPKTADAILTDSIGETFEQKMNDLYPKPVPEPVQKVETDEDDKTAKDKDKNAKEVEKLKDDSDHMRPVSSFGHGKGTIFLVDRQSRAVIWSVYARPKNSSADTLDSTAEHVINKLKRDLMPPHQGT